MKLDKDTFEIIFFARGGQGAKVAAEILAQAASSEGKYVQAYPFFGPERSGAPTKIFLRVSDQEIRTHELIFDPNVVVVMDDTILEAVSVDVSQNLDEHEIMIVNTNKSAEVIREKTKFPGKIFTVDANGISLEIIGQPRPNTVVLGKIVQVTEIASLEAVTNSFRNIFLEKIGEEATQKNILAIEKAYDAI